MKQKRKESLIVSPRENGCVVNPNGII